MNPILKFMLDKTVTETAVYKKPEIITCQPFFPATLQLAASVKEPKKNREKN